MRSKELSVGLKAQIWGRVQKNVGSIERPNEHIGFHHLQMEDV